MFPRRLPFTRFPRSHLYLSLGPRVRKEATFDAPDAYLDGGRAGRYPKTLVLLWKAFLTHALRKDTLARNLLKTRRRAK